MAQELSPGQGRYNQVTRTTRHPRLYHHRGLKSTFPTQRVPSTPRLLRVHCQLQAHLTASNGAADVWELVTLLHVVYVAEHSASAPFASEAC